MKFADFMYWLPLFLVGLIFLTYVTYKEGIDGLRLFLILGIIFISLFLWSRYWLNRKYRKE